MIAFLIEFDYDAIEFCRMVTCLVLDQYGKYLDYSDGLIRIEIQCFS